MTGKRPWGAGRSRLTALIALVVLLGSGGLAGVGADSAITVLPADGRSPQSVPVVVVEGNRFLPLAPLARALAVPFSWDPFTFRGWIRPDSIQFGFSLASPVITRGSEAIQLDSGFGYGEAGVLVPIDFLALVTEGGRGSRTIQWQPDQGALRWGSPLPMLRELRYRQIGHRSTVEIPCPKPVRARLLWAALGGLEAHLEGVTANPDSLVVETPRGSINLTNVFATRDGCSLQFEIDPSVVGISQRFDEVDQVWRLHATTSREELMRGGFAALERVDADRIGAPRGPILLAVWVDPLVDPSEAGRTLRDLAERVAEVLSGRLGIEAVILEGSEPIGMAARANGYDAPALIGLRIDRYLAAVDRVQILSGAGRMPWRSIGREGQDSLAVIRPPLWSEAPALDSGRSERLALLLAEHLAPVAGADRIEVGRRPSQWLEGLTMPAVAIYPSIANDPGSMDRLVSRGRRGEIARAIAIGISEAIRSGLLRERQ